MRLPAVAFRDPADNLPAGHDCVQFFHVSLTNGVAARFNEGRSSQQAGRLVPRPLPAFVGCLAGSRIRGRNIRIRLPLPLALSYHNELFGDSIELIGAWESPQGMRLIILQPAIAGQPADEPQIRTFFEDSGWQPFQIGLDLAYFDPDPEIAISDTHPGNLVLMDDGTLAPIDLRVQKLSPNLAEAVRGLVAQY